MIEMTSEVRPFLSFVSPVYRARPFLNELRDRVDAVCRELSLTYELILVDDRCPDNSWEVIKSLAQRHPEVRGFRLSRNFGQHPAIQAGLSEAKGEWIVVLDCDLQDQPESLPILLDETRKGFDIVRARRVSRQDSWGRRVASRLFYRALSYLTDTQQSPEVANFGVYHRKVIAALLSWHEEMKFFPVIVAWLGFSSSDIPVEHASRHSGSSSYRLRSLLNLGVDVVLSFSDKPLRLIAIAGILLSGLSFLAAVTVFILYLLGRVTVPGWATTVLSTWFLGGTLIAVMGITGIYVGRVLREAKGRPSFVMDETT